MSFRSRMLTEKHKFQGNSDRCCAVRTQLMDTLLGDSNICGNYKNEEEIDQWIDTVQLPSAIRREVGRGSVPLL